MEEAGAGPVFLGRIARGGEKIRKAAQMRSPGNLKSAFFHPGSAIAFRADWAFYQVAGSTSCAGRSRNKQSTTIARFSVLVALVLVLELGSGVFFCLSQARQIVARSASCRSRSFFAAFFLAVGQSDCRCTNSTGNNALFQEFLSRDLFHWILRCCQIDSAGSRNESFFRTAPESGTI